MDYSNKHPEFTPDELRCIHKEIASVSWNSERFYEERKSVVQKLDRYFKGDVKHIRGLNR